MVLHAVAREIIYVPSACKFEQVFSIGSDQNIITLFISLTCFHSVACIDLTWFWVLNPNFVAEESVVKYSIFSLAQLLVEIYIQISAIDL